MGIKRPTANTREISFGQLQAMLSRLLTAEQFGARLNPPAPGRTVRAWIARGLVPAEKIGGAYRISPDLLEGFERPDRGNPEWGETVPHTILVKGGGGWAVHSHHRSGYGAMREANKLKRAHRVVTTEDAGKIITGSG